MLNPFFLQGSKGEQSLVQDLINEQLKIYGVEVYYLPREYVTEKTVIKEVVESQFTNAFPIEAYVDTYDGYGGQGTLLSKFGIQEVDDLTLIVSKERYEDYIYPLAKDIPNVKLASRPKEGDLIYFPLGDKLFEIKYVEHEKPFYQLQKNYVYELKCELYRYQDELIDTEVDFIDDSMESEGYIQTLQLVGIGSTATAITNIVDGGVRYVSVTKRGSSYTSTPTVAFSSSPAITAVGFATMIKGIVDLCEVSPDLSRVQSVNLSNSGAGYTVAPMVTFIGGGGSGAEATSYIGDGLVGIVTITSGGGGYVSAPLVTFESPIGPGAAATVTVSAAGTVTAVTIDNGGAHYNPSSPPTVTFSTPLDRINGVTSLIPSSTLPQGSNFTSGVYTTTNVSLGATGSGLTLDVTVNGSGAVTAAEIADPGQHYANGNIVNITNG